MHALDLADDSFDVVHAHQVLQHVADPVAALREMARVTRPGGVVGVRDSDYAAFAWYPRLPGLDRWLALYQAAARANGGEPDAGRHLLAWAHAAGLHRRHGERQHLVLRDARDPRVVGRDVGRAGHRYGARASSSCATASPPPAELEEVAAPGARGPPTPTAGSACRTGSSRGHDRLTAPLSSRTSRDRMSSSAARIGAESPLKVRVSRA